MPRLAYGLYGLAFLGIHLAFMPLMVLLLPRRVAAIAPDIAPTLLSWLLLVGGFVAAASYIAAGALSDDAFARDGSRRRPIVLGLIGLFLAYGMLTFATSPARLFMAVVAFQIALNVAFAPLGALLTDYFPDARKGLMAGIMNGALPVSSGCIALVGWAFAEDGAGAFIATGVVSIVLVAPLMIWWPFADRVAPDQADDTAFVSATASRTDFALAWVARLLVQLGAAFLLGYLYLYLGAVIADDPGANGRSASDWIALISLPAGALALTATIGAGWLSDRWQMRRWPLVVASLALAASFAAIASGSSLLGFLLAYAAFQAGLACFLSVETALVAQLVSGHARRGALLGVMNLTNTLPAIIAPALALLAFRERDIAPALSDIFFACALGALIAAVAMAAIRQVR